MEIKNLSEILTESKEKKVEKTPTLRFVASISGDDGIQDTDVKFQPYDWKNVVHITENLYYAYDNDPDFGCVYLGQRINS